MGDRGSIVGAIVLSIVFAIVDRDRHPTRPENADIRDKQIERHGDRIGQAIVAFGALGALVLAMLEVDLFWIGNTLFFIGAVGARWGTIVSIRAYRGCSVVKATRVTNTIRALRFAHGEMTQAELAERLGVTRQTVIAIEQGRYSPSLEMAFQIARVFGVALDEVFQYPEGWVGDPDIRFLARRRGRRARGTPQPRRA